MDGKTALYFNSASLTFSPWQVRVVKDNSRELKPSVLKAQKRDIFVVQFF